MPKICYVPKQFNAEHTALIASANAIIAEYDAQGFTLTLRQIYYQFVARGWLKNQQREYKRLGEILSDARLAGEIDWEAMEDRTRYLRSLSHWDAPSDIIESAAASFRLDRWESQPARVEVWIEKDALVGVIEPVCQGLDVPYFSCRGYTSQSEMWVAARRFVWYANAGQSVLVLHFGDHSGIDMSRDIAERVRLFMGGRGRFELRRLALNMEQVEEYSPPPNPAKLTDSRCAGYVQEYGDDSWELDALEPSVIAALVTAAVRETREDGPWNKAAEEEARGRKQLAALSNRYDEAIDALDLER